MGSKSKSEIQKFTHYFGPILEALRVLGGSGTVQEVVNQVAGSMGVPDEALAEVLPSGALRFQNRIQFARLYLAKEGLITNSKRGVWALSDMGAKAVLTNEQANSIFQKWTRIFTEERRKASPAAQSISSASTNGEPEDPLEGVDYRGLLLSTLKTLPPDGFERFCQELLREAGFTEVKVTGKSGDGGIDGYGNLKVNELVNFKVLFQCKRYGDSVPPDKLRDFRGAMQGRADKGLFLTTGTFTSASKNEASRDGVPPIELIDGQRIIELCETLEFGLTPFKTYEIDSDFFEKFRGKIEGN